MNESHVCCCGSMRKVGLTTRILTACRRLVFVRTQPLVGVRSHTTASKVSTRKQTQVRKVTRLKMRSQAKQITHWQWSSIIGLG